MATAQKNVESEAYLPPQQMAKKKQPDNKGGESQGEKDEYFPDFNQLKRVGLKVEKKRVAAGTWTITQTKIYLKFLEDYREDFSSEAMRRKLTVFNRLSKALRKRTPDQCRSHHQKLQNKFNNDLNQIIEYVRRKLRKMLQAEAEEDAKLKAQGATGTRDYSMEDDGLVVDFPTLFWWPSCLQ